MKIKSQKDFFAGLMFMAVGIAFAWGATTYTIGEGARMGPGYFPLMLGVLLAGLGAFVMFEALVVETEDGEPIGTCGLEAAAASSSAPTSCSACCWAACPGSASRPMGLIVAIYALTFIAALAGDEFKAKEVAILATVLAIGSYLAFIVLLKLQFPVWPSFISG